MITIDILKVDMLAAFAAVVGVWMCGILNLRAMLWGLAVQTAILAVAVFVHGHETQTAHYILMAGIVLLVKSIAIPIFLGWIAEKINVLRDKGTGISTSIALFTGCAALAAGHVLAPFVKGVMSADPGAGGMAVALLLIGVLLMLTRRLALSQIIGFLVLENGIFLYALTQTSGMPMLVEMGVVFDVLVGVMVAGLVIFRISRSFEHVDVTKLTGLQK